MTNILETDAHLGPLAGHVDEALNDLNSRDAVNRLWARDHTLWQEDPTEVADRLGWLDLPATAASSAADLEEFATACTADGIARAVILGMGGSSLFPLVLSESADTPRLDVDVLDTVDPSAVRRALEAAAAEETLVVASSKSGTTVETRTLLEAFWERRADGSRFVAITDPGTPLAELAADRGFRLVVAAPSDVGGRFSALTPFGLLPGALAGAPLPALAGSAAAMAAACQRSGDGDPNPGAHLAAFLAGGARSGRDKLTVFLPPRIAAFGAWIEQLVAESTGKHGTGIVPVVGERIGPPEEYGDDRIFLACGEHDHLDALVDAGHPVIRLELETPADLGGEVLRWEVATALAGSLLGVNPFDQPDVEAAKRAAREALGSGASLPDAEPLEPLVASLRPGDYLAILAYLDPESPTLAAIEDARAVLRARTGAAVTLGIGPRYLHSTGQLHKGGPPSGVFAQLVVDEGEDLPVPGESFTFGELKRAQAAGDLAALHSRDRRAARVDVDELLALV